MSERPDKRAFERAGLAATGAAPGLADSGQAAPAHGADEYRRLMDHLPAPVLRYDARGKRRYLNAAAERMLRAPAAALLGYSPCENGVLAPETAIAFVAAVAAVAATQTARDIELVLDALPGDEDEYYSAHLMPEATADGEPGVLAVFFDITARKRAERRLQDRESFLASLLDTIPIPVFYKDRQGHYLGFNKAYEEFFGTSQSQLVGKTAYDIAPKDLADIYHAADEALYAAGGTQRYESKVRNIAGDLRDVMFSKAAFCDKQGAPAGLIGALLDITERNRREAEQKAKYEEILQLNERLEEGARSLEEYAVELEASQEQLKSTEAWYRGILHSAPDGMLVVDERGVVTLVNRELARMFGYSESELLGQPIDLLIADDPDGRHGDMRAALAEAMARETSTQLAGDRRARRKDGFEFLVQIALSRLPDSDDCAGVLCVSIRDVSERRRMEAALKRQEREFRTLAENAPDVIMRYDRQCRRIYVNPAFVEAIGLPAQALLGGRPTEYSSSPEAAAYENALRRVLRSGEACEHEYPWVTSNGRSLISLFNIVPEIGADGTVESVLAIGRDITERKRMEEALARREQEFRTLVENSRDTVERYGPDLRRIYVNPALAALAESSTEEMIGTGPQYCPGGDNATTYERHLIEVFESGCDVEFELKRGTEGEEELCCLMRLTPEFNAEGKVESVLSIGRDITELHAYRQRIHQMAFYDPLTGLPNRALFADRLRQMVTDASWHKQLAGVMMIDMDRFKEVNDTMGHTVGDELLREAAARLSGCVRAYDTVARLGGDEFAILLPEIRSGDDLGRIASKILERFGERFLLDGKEIFLSCSIGIALFPDDSTEASDLVKYADSAMYYAKRSGRNDFRFYSRELTASANERLALESELRRAIERHELQLHYQPKVLLQTGEIAGAEALLRWHSAKFGWVSPAQFIPIAEDTGLIVELGEWVLGEACRTAAEKNAGGGPVCKIAVNLSARQFQAHNLQDVVSAILWETACRPEWLELEITESLLLDEFGTAQETLSAFKAMGLSIAIDDFGTGYSALGYLARFPIDTLKIDKSFIHGIGADEYQSELVKAVLSMARCLKQQVVAEGVETPEQAAFLKANGCEVAQGFLFSKPLPKAELAKLPRCLGADLF